jgi:hypothetical protein
MYTLSPHIVEGLRYWLAKRGGDALPKRAALDPLLEIPHLTPRMVIAELLADGERIRYRLIGTEIVAHRGVDMTGRMVDEATYGANWRAMYDPMISALREKEPTIGITLGAPKADFRVGVESVHLPLADAENAPRFLLNLVIFSRPAGLAAEDMKMNVPLRMQNESRFVWRRMRDAKPGWERAVASIEDGANFAVVLGPKPGSTSAP